MDWAQVRLSVEPVLSGFNYHFFYIKCEVVSWKCLKQNIVVDFTSNAKYIIVSNVAKEVVKIKMFVSEFGIFHSIVDPIELYNDKNGFVAQDKEPRSQQ